LLGREWKGRQGDGREGENGHKLGHEIS